MSKALVHVRVGGDLGDGQPPFVGSPEECESYRAEFQEALGEEYVVVATHHMVEAIVYEDYDS